MSSLLPEFLNQHSISQQLLQTIRLIGEYKGKEALWKQQSPQVLEALRSIALIISTESSNRIEGIEAPHSRIVELVNKKTTPANRSEQEIAGYRDVLSMIHASYAEMPFTANLILQLHRDLYKYMPQSGGHWKNTDNSIVELSEDGTSQIRFTPVPAFQTAEAMNNLHKQFDLLEATGDYEPLILNASYVFDFLCIHPFQDGNGRMSRLITLLLLYKSGYEVGRYISLERVIENNKESYYDALKASSQQWHEGHHTLTPWWQYFLGIMLLTTYREFEDRVGITSTARGAKKEMVIDAINRLPVLFQISEIIEACPNISRPTINRVLQEMTKDRKIHCIKPGRDATWQKISD